MEQKNVYFFVLFVKCGRTAGQVLQMLVNVNYLVVVVVARFVDGLGDRDTLAVLVKYGQAQNAPGYVAGDLVDGGIESGVQIGIGYVERLGGCGHVARYALVVGYLDLFRLFLVGVVHRVDFAERGRRANVQNVQVLLLHLQRVGRLCIKHLQFKKKYFKNFS